MSMCTKELEHMAQNTNSETCDFLKFVNLRHHC